MSMKNAILVSVLTSVLLVGAAAVYAGPPLNGSWSSNGGTVFDEGTATSSWAGPLGYLNLGNILYGRSYAGGSFTNDWQIGCPVVTAVVVIIPKGGPTGNETYHIKYAGGYVTLGGPGNPWDGGDPVYTGTITQYDEFRTVTYVNNKIVGATSDHSVSATIQGYSNSCVAWAIGNGVLRGGTPPGAPGFTYPPLQSVKGANYPGYPDAACALLGAGTGHWDDIKDLTVSVAGCTVATEKSTWGSVKAMYRD
jgi:hypothetical protein